VISVGREPPLLKNLLFCEETTREFREAPPEKAFPRENQPPLRPGCDRSDRLVSLPAEGNRRSRDPASRPRKSVWRPHCRSGRNCGPTTANSSEVFFTVFNALESFEGKSTLLVWIFGITRNTVNRRFRKARRSTEVLDADGAAAASDQRPATDRVVDARRALRRCEAVIENDFTPLQRRIFHLKHLRRQPIRGIALALGKSEDAVKANLYRMRRAISDAVPGLDTLLRT